MSAGKRAWKKSAFSESLNKTVEKEEDEANDHSKPKKSTTTTAVKARKTPLITLRNWIEIFEPRVSEELALHPKKLAELEKWFLDCNSAAVGSRNPESKIASICLVSGPSGAGKTAAVRVLASKYRFQLQEWINPLDQEAIHTLGDQPSGDAYVVSHLTNFKSFLFHASRYKSLLDDSHKRLLLVEDFPNALLSNGAAFEEILSEYVDYGRSPLVFIVSDSKSRGLNISYNLFPDEIKQKYEVGHVTFNPIANTIMQKAMKRFSELVKNSEMGVDNYKTPTQSVIESIVVSAQGDIRNAMINFHFAALQGAPEISLSESKSEKGEGKVRSKKNTSLKSVGRDESITMLHALGRVLNPKYTSENVFVHCPEEIAEGFSTEPKKFLDFIHANSLKHFTEIEHIVLAADCISSADILLQEYRSDLVSTIALNVATRGLMVANRKPASGWHPVRGPKRIQTSVNSSVMQGLPHNVYVMDCSTYVKIIAPPKQQ